MPVRSPACVERAAETCNPQPAPADLAERRLRSHPYLALKNVSCGWLDGVLVLRGCLPAITSSRSPRRPSPAWRGDGR